MTVPETLADNWLVVILFLLFGGSGALLSKRNAENFWIVGWVYRRYRDRRQIALEREESQRRGIEVSLQAEVDALRTRLDHQQRYCEQQFAEQEDEIRDVRRHNLSLLRYVAEVKRWALTAVETAGGDVTKVPYLPDFQEWQEERRSP